MSNLLWSKRSLGAAILTLGAFAMLSGKTATAAEDSEYKVADGLAVYLGVAPAEIVKGHLPSHAEQTMHGGAPSGRHEYHVVVAVFETGTGKRVTDAVVTAQISGLGLVGAKKKLEPMEIADTISYGGFFDLPGADLYTVALTIQRAGAEQPVLVNFSYDHRR
ncbi:hypothetical protein [Rhodoblastus sp.]|jgi:hypothetical protein|uniref:hypothetical protein n=1 Tax=Rhodoblastus sp. TaxID=1962975 RepID=UPI0025F104B6|nr:hypothetical protein [Rhodoblastus sp.]